MSTNGYKMARFGYEWVLTQRGYDKTPDEIQPYRAVGTPVWAWSIYTDSVPVSWVAKGYVEEVPITETV